MGYDSSIEIKKEEIEEVGQLLKKLGFKLASSKSNRFQLFSYHKYIDDNCKYEERTVFGVSKTKSKYYILGKKLDWVYRILLMYERCISFFIIIINF